VSSVPIEVPDAVRRKALAVGPRGEQWIAELPSVIAELEREWRISVGAPITGGSSGYVAEAVGADGTPAVLKLAIPDGLDGQGDFARELATLLLANGRGYVSVLNADEYRRAMLQERLGRSLDDLALPVESQIEIIATTLGQSWRRPSQLPPTRTGREQARDVAQAIVARWERLGQPCPRPTVEQAIDYAHARSKAFDAATAVLIHGDAHPANILEAVPGGGPHGEFKLIDPDGMLSEPAHDLGIPLRDWSDELLARDAAELGLEWCTQLSRISGVDSRAIWQWAFLERVSTGLFMMFLRDPDGEKLLAVAARWTGHEPD
jgi:streptomycin 6-kinase